MADRLISPRAGYRLVPLLLALLCAAAFALQLSFVSRQDFLLGYDSANYADVAASIAEGRGFRVDFVLHFFEKFPQVTRPEDRRLSISSLAIALSFLLFGKSALAAKLLNILLGTVTIPLSTYLLARTLSLRREVGVLAALSALVLPNISILTYGAMADLLFTQFCLLSVWALVRSREDDRWLYAAGAAIGLCYLTKAQGILLLPIAFLYYASVRGLLPAVKNRHLYLAALLAVLVMSPFLIRNTLQFGDPFYSTIRFDVGYGGDYQSAPLKWWHRTFRLYWDAALPSYLAEMSRYSLAVFAAKVLKQLRIAASLLSPIVFLSLPSIYVFWRRPEIRGLWLVVALYISIICFFFFFHTRYEVPVIPIILVLLWGGLEGLLGRIRQRLFRRRALSIAVLGAVFLAVFFPALKSSVGQLTAEPFRFQGALIDIARWSREHLPARAVVMTHDPALFNFYSGLRAVQIPYDEPEQVARVLEHYRVSHAVPWTLEREVYEEVSVSLPYRDNYNIRLLDPSLPYGNLAALVRGLDPLYGNGGLFLYRIK